MAITVAKMLGKFNSLDIQLESAKIMLDTEAELINLNQQQLFRGEDAKGSQLPRYKNLRYAQKKYKMNSLPGVNVPDYKFSGTMYREMFVDVDRGDNRLHIWSMAPYTADLFDRGGDPFGLQPTSKRTYVNNTFHSRIVRRIGDITGVKVV